MNVQGCRLEGGSEHLMSYPANFRRSMSGLLRTFCRRSIKRKDPIFDLPIKNDVACPECLSILEGKVVTTERREEAPK